MNYRNFIKRTFLYLKDAVKDFHKSDSTKLLVFSLPLILMLILYSIVTLFILKKPSLALWELTCSLLALSSNIIYKITRSYKLAANVLIFAGVLILSAVSFYAKGVSGPVIFWIFLCPLCAGMIIDKKAILYWGMVSLGIIAGFIHYDSFIQNFNSTISDDQLLTSLKHRTLFGTLLFSMLMSYIYKTLVEMAEREAKSEKTKAQNLLRIVTHDIGNSLALIQGAQSLMTRFSDNPKKMVNLKEKCELGIQSMADVLTQVREMEALKSGKSSIKLQKVDLLKVIDDSFSMFEEKLESKQIKFFKEIKTFKNLYVVAEPISLSNQVLNNILSNAIKFSKRNGEIRIIVFEEKNQFVIEVQDNGVGIPSEILNKIFDPSQKTSSLGTEGEKGTGFGMPLMKIFIDLYDGDIQIESKTETTDSNEHGTKIRIYLKQYYEEEMKLAS